MNKLCCFLSGGHKYSLSNIVSHRNEINRTIGLKNHCIKCGKTICFEMPDTFIDEEIKKEKLKLWRRWGYGT